MDQRHERLERFRRTRAVVVVRGSVVKGLPRLAGELAKVGLDIFEVTMTTPGALQGIEEIRAASPDTLVGAGTVLTAKLAEAAVRAGSQFIVSPTLDYEVISIARENRVLAIPGSFTPTEAFKAWNAGADIVKVFPALVGGPAYIKALRAPLPELRLLPTGGITTETAAAYLEAGAFAVCLGTSFLDATALAVGNYEGVVKAAQQLVKRLEDAAVDSPALQQEV